MTEPLTITTSPRDDHQLDLTIELGPERTDQALHRAATQVSKRVNIPGFRRGHAPYNHILRTIGRDALLNEILDDLGQEVYQEALDAQNIKPYAIAKVVDVSLEPPTFKLVVPLEPEVDLNDYHSVRVTKDEVTVTDEDVDQVIEQRQNGLATWAEIERPAEMGDTVTIDIHGSVGEDTIMDNHDWDLLLKEEAGWLPGFAESFVGMKAGDEKSFTLTYPEDSASRYKGQEANFQATVKTVKARIAPELNDEFAKGQGDYENMEAYRAALKENLRQQRESAAEDKLANDAVNALIEKATLAFPPAAVDETVDELINDMGRRVNSAGYELEDYLRLSGTTLEAYRETVRPAAEQRLKGRLVLSKLAEVEHVEVSPEDIQAAIDRMAPESEDSRMQSLRSALSTESGQAVVANDVRTEKTLARLREIVTGEATSESNEDASKGEAEDTPETGPQAAAAGPDEGAEEQAGEESPASTEA